MKGWKKKTIAGLIVLLGVNGITTSSGAEANARKVPAYHAHKQQLDDDFLIVAHRGVSGLAPEHTMASYDLVKKNKGDYLEIDLQMTKDGKLIAMHDTTLDRTTNGTGKVSDHTLAQIKQLDAGSWFNEKYPEKAQKAYAGQKVPTLEEIFTRYGRSANYYIETKSPDVYPGMEQELVRLLKKYKISRNTPGSHKVLIQSFSKESLLIVKNLNPSLPLVQLLSYGQDANGKIYEKSGLTSAPDKVTAKEWEAIRSYAVGVGPGYKVGGKIVLDKSFVSGAHSHHLAVHPYTVDLPEDMKTLMDMGVTGMFTDYPYSLYELLHKKK
ncbi:glycerophosphodiester phosphodiesterase [Bacillus massiliglaciei]|uniref:glycerophosphodiester phosphodiesterase n=1 Tax=Bacillus massiliglaciei TaxID=1816693 RepID=UPI000AA79EB8|nr:glycerophosphodiester phosphodiesterase [Bacillus massiliglaciei]